MFVSFAIPNNLLARFRVIITTVTMIFPLNLGFSSAVAQNYPRPVDRYVNDYAQIISDRDEQEVNNLLSKLEIDKGIQGKVVTIPAISFYDTKDKTIESFATNLFNDWQIGNAQTNKGLLLLVAVSDRKVRIEMGKGFGSAYNTAMSNIIKENIVPSFKRNNYSQGIKNGTVAIVNTFDQNTNVIPQPIASNRDSSPSLEETQEIQNNLPPLVIFFILIGAIATVSQMTFPQPTYDSNDSGWSSGSDSGGDSSDSGWNSSSDSGGDSSDSGWSSSSDSGSDSSSDSSDSGGSSSGDGSSGDW